MAPILSTGSGKSHVACKLEKVRAILFSSLMMPYVQISFAGWSTTIINYFIQYVWIWFKDDNLNIIICSNFSQLEYCLSPHTTYLIARPTEIWTRQSRHPRQPSRVRESHPQHPSSKQNPHHWPMQLWPRTTAALDRYCQCGWSPSRLYCVFIQ